MGPQAVYRLSLKMRNVISLILLALPGLLASTAQAQFEWNGWKVSNDSGYVQPNSTGLKLQNGFERVFIQVRHSVTCLAFSL